ncbi:MAG: GNAT family N-acetyltransferase [Candidatus Dormibacteria bacterium]
MSVTLQPVRRTHAMRLCELYITNRTFLEPFSPVFDDRFFTETAHLERIEALRRLAREDRTYGYTIDVDGELAGTLTISDVIRGSFQSAHLGYWVSRHLNGRGVATLAVRQAVRMAFDELELHRLQAATLVRNVASRRVLDKNRFSEIGLARGYLRINGRWQDHVLYARVATGT